MLFGLPYCVSCFSSVCQLTAFGRVADLADMRERTVDELKLVSGSSGLHASLLIASSIEDAVDLYTEPASSSSSWEGMCSTLPTFRWPSR